MKGRIGRERRDWCPVSVCSIIAPHTLELICEVLTTVETAPLSAFEDCFESIWSEYIKPWGGMKQNWSMIFQITFSSRRLLDETR